MTFPTPFTVQHYEYIGGPDTLDELGNEVEDWADPKPVAVQGWQKIAKEKLGPSAQGEIADTAMSVPVTFSPNIRDRIGLPDDGIYEVVELDMQSNGFHGWRPGNVVMLKRATGI